MNTAISPDTSPLFNSELFPMLANALRNPVMAPGLSEEDSVSPLHDGLFVRSIETDSQSMRVEGELTVVTPAQALTLQMDVYENTAGGRKLLVPGKPYFSYGGAADVEAFTEVPAETGYGKDLLVVLNGTKNVGNGVVSSQTFYKEFEIGPYVKEQPVLDEIQIDDPVSHRTPPADHIYICYNRRVQAKEKEDYFVPAHGGEDFYIPLKGRAYFNDISCHFLKALPPEPVSGGADEGKEASILHIFMREGQGGEVSWQNTADAFCNAFRPIEETKDDVPVRTGFSWDFGQQPWVTRSPFSKSTAFDMDFDFRLVYQLRSGELHTMDINSYSVRRYDAKQIPFLRIYWGCLYKDTRITMSDGSLVPVQDIRPGMLVKSRQKNLRVKNVVEGREPMGVLLIRTASKEVYASSGHPFLTDHGILTAQELCECPDAAICTDDGQAEAVEEITRYIFEDDRVYNLILESEDQQPLPWQEHTFFANGLMTGDNEMMKAAAVNRMEKLRQQYGISEAWRTDVESARTYFKICNEGDILWNTQT